MYTYYMESVRITDFAFNKNHLNAAIKIHTEQIWGTAHWKPDQDQKQKKNKQN